MTAVVLPRPNLTCLMMLRSVPRHCAAAAAGTPGVAPTVEATQPARAMIRKRLFIFEVPSRVSSGSRRSGRRQSVLNMTVATRDPAAEVFGKLLDGRLYGPRGGVAERAETLPLDVVHDVQEELRVVGAAFTRLDALEDLDQPVGALAAGSAPAARLVLVELGQVLGGLEDVHRLVHHDKAARADRRAGGDQPLVVHPHVLPHDVGGRHDVDRRAAGDDGFQLPPARDALTVLKDELLHVVVAHRQLVDAGAVDVTRHRPDLRPAALFSPEFLVSLAPELDDVG